MTRALKFITCGSVDDGKSTLIGRLLVDSRSVLQDQLAGVQRGGQTDLALLTDGLSAEREQGITIDVAYRYFSTARRKFIIGDTPGHEQYTRNMVTAASSADAAVVLVDATKLPWAGRDEALDFSRDALLLQTRRHTLLVQLLRVPSVVFAINKLDAVQDSARAFARIHAVLTHFAQAASLQPAAIVPVSALHGWNVVTGAADDAQATADWCGYDGPTLLSILEQLPATPQVGELPLAFPVQWVEKFSSSSDTSQGRRIFWGRLASGQVQPGAEVQIFPSGQRARVTQVLNHARHPAAVNADQSGGLILDREVDVSRGDWLLAPASFKPARELLVTVAWMDEEPLLAGRTYWALHGHRWVKARVKRILHRLDIHTLATAESSELVANSIGQVELSLQSDLTCLPYRLSRTLGSLVLVDTASHRTAGAALVSG
jgi:sulfate adenylyltransferase subunit 1